MKIDYFHASQYGNGAKVAEEFKRIMEAKGNVVSIRHVRDVRPKEIAPADLYIFSSPGRFGKPIGSVRRFLKKVNLPSGSSYAILVTEMNPHPEKKTGVTMTEGETGACQQVIPNMNELLQAKGGKKVVEGRIFVTGIKGPLEDEWQRKVAEFVAIILESC